MCNACVLEMAVLSRDLHDLYYVSGIVLAICRLVVAFARIVDSA